MIEKRDEAQNVILVMYPNRSASWTQSKWFLVVMMVPMFSIAIGWSLLGAWLILPFAGLEFFVLALATYLVSYRSYQCDLIEIGPEHLRISFAIGFRPSKVPTIKVLKRSHTHLYVTKPKKPMDLTVLHLADHTQCWEVGHFLNEEDREQLRSELVAAGVIECVDRWWQSH